MTPETATTRPIRIEKEWQELYDAQFKERQELQAKHDDEMSKR